VRGPTRMLSAARRLWRAYPLYILGRKRPVFGSRPDRQNNVLRNPLAPIRLRRARNHPFSYSPTPRFCRQESPPVAAAHWCPSPYDTNFFRRPRANIMPNTPNTIPNPPNQLPLIPLHKWRGIFWRATRDFQEPAGRGLLSCPMRSLEQVRARVSLPQRGRLVLEIRCCFVWRRKRRLRYHTMVSVARLRRTTAGQMIAHAPQVLGNGERR
jgi:hypothetical protein